MNSLLSEYGSYLLIPFIAALAGWATNWLAIKMTFYPLEYVGRFPFGWRGVVPSRIRKFASGLVDTTIGRIGGLQALLDSVDTNEVRAQFLDTATGMIPGLVHELMREQKQLMWENLPAATKKAVFEMVDEGMRDGFDSLAEDLHTSFERLLDLRELVVDKCERTPDLLNKLIYACAGRELSFLIVSGAFFGFTFGVVQALVWWFIPQWWVLPFFGFLVGTLTNWIAIQLIFSPVEPMKIGPVVFQGLFLRRQNEISREFSRVFTQEIVTAEDVVKTLLHGKRSARTLALLRSHISDIMEQNLVVQLITQAATGPQGYVDLKDAALKKTIQATEEMAEIRSLTKMQAEAVQSMLEDRLAAQSPYEFQDIIRPIFHEDEWILVIIGGVLGALVGWGQLAFLFV